LIADETAVSATGLAKRPSAYPPSTHAYALSSHLVYGFVTETVRRVLRLVP
jgi:putative membrane protein